MTTLAKLRSAHKPHPLKKFFRDRKVTNYELGAYINRSWVSVQKYLNGTQKMPADIEKQLRELALQIRREENQDNSDQKFEIVDENE